MLEFAAKTVIYSPFSTEKKVFVVTHGYVSAHTIDDSGREQIHLMYAPNSYFPVLTTYFKKSQRATYTSLTKVTVEAYDTSVFLHMIDSDHKFCKSILLQTAEQLGAFADRIINLETVGAEAKLKNRIWGLCKVHGKRVGDVVYLPYELTHQQVAGMIGVERETVSRLLARLIKKGDICKSSLGTYGIPAC